MQNIDGRMLYLKTVSGEEVKTIDSCDVVHGQFAFSGNVDSAKVAALFINNESIMPVVLEEGEINIKFNLTKQTCSGTPLNDKLAEFIEKYNQITNQISDLQHQHDKAIMDGEDMDIVSKNLQNKYNSLTEEYDKCITSFVEENFDNILGPFVFQMVTGDMEVPMTNPWIEALMTKATDKFKNDKYVKDFMDAAARNQAIMTGMEDPVATTPANVPQQLDATPTPNELATPESAAEQ